MAWNAATYLKFGGERTRAAADLLARVSLASPRHVVDLGCGPGNSTELLRARYPEARITAIDNSEAMITAAKASGVRADFVLADVSRWAPEEPVDLIYANATLHWLDDHERLFTRLAGHVSERGVLAIQMPRNFKAPSHRILAELARSQSFAHKLASVVRAEPVADPGSYYRWLKPLATRLDVFEIEYLQVLKGKDPVLNWVRGTALLPYLAALDEAQAQAFEAEYRARLLAAYPEEPTGETLFPFLRIFIVATIA